MRRELAAWIRERLVTDPQIRDSGLSVWLLRAPVGTARPWCIVAGEGTEREETARDTVIVQTVVSVTIAGEKLEEEVERLTKRAFNLLEDYIPSDGVVDVMRGQVEQDPEYGVEDDGAGDVYLGRFLMRFWLKHNKGA